MRKSHGTFSKNLSEHFRKTLGTFQKISRNFSKKLSELFRNYEDQQKVIKLYQKSGQKNKSDYLRARLLGESFKLITEEKSDEKYLRKLSIIISLIYKIGVLYNEAVKTLNCYHSTATAQRMLRKLEAFSKAIVRLQEQAIVLTIKY